MHHLDGALWRGESEQLRQILVLLLRGHAEVSVQNRVGFSPSDVAIGLKCVKSWNAAMRQCGYFEQVLDVSYSDNLYRHDPDKQYRLEKLWEDYNHFSSWRCQPHFCCTGRGRLWGSQWIEQCPWWEEYEAEWRDGREWHIKFPTWEEL